MPETIDKSISRLKRQLALMTPEERGKSQKKIDEVKSELSHAIVYFNSEVLTPFRLRFVDLDGVDNGTPMRSKY